MPSALFVSPHFDDVAFSCGGALHALARAGWETTLCTVFTRIVPDPQGFALACQLDKGLPPDADYMALRRAEDDAAALALGAARVDRLELAEAPHRGYESAAALFGPYAASDGVAPELAALLAGRVAGHDAVFVPQALGAHADHRRVRDSVLALAATGDATRASGSSAGAHTSRSGDGLPLGDRLAWYRDAPYVLRDPHGEPSPEVAALAPVTAAMPLDAAALAAKLDACAAYATQLGFQFGSAAAMRAALGGFASDEAVRLGRAGVCERLRTRAPLASALAALTAR